VICYIFPIVVCLDEENSGNPAAEPRHNLFAWAVILQSFAKKIWQQLNAAGENAVLKSFFIWKLDQECHLQKKFQHLQIAK
jgi:hypothetical protein